MAHKPTYEELEQRIEELEKESVERKRVEGALEASTRRYKAIVEGSPDMIYVLDSEGHFSFVGGAVESLLGFTLEELIGKHFTSIIWPEDIKKAERHFGERRTGERSTRGFEVRLITRGGGKKDVDIKCLSVELYSFGVYDKPVSAKDKRFLGTYGVARDITDRKRAEKALRTAAQQWRTTFDAISEATCLLDMEGKILRCNKAMTNLLGKSFEEIIGGTCWELVHGTSEPVEGCPVGRMCKTGRRETLVLEIDDQYLKVTADPLIDETGNLKGAVHIITNITERKKAEEALEQKVVELNSFINNIPDMAWIKDINSNFIAANKAFGNAVGMEPEYLINHNCEICFGKEAAEKFRQDDKRVMESRKQTVIEESITVEGKKAYLETIKSPIFDESGEVVGTVGVARDITERKKAEEALKADAERLEEMVEERTQDLRDAQEQLVRHEKLTVMGQLAGGLGHELRNPLGAIRNAAYFLSMALEEPEQEIKEALEILDNEVVTSERIINSLLDFARPKPPTWHNVDINDVVQATLSRVPVPENVEVLRQLSEMLPMISGDADQLAQVFGNLILNAFQAMPEGGRLVVKSEAASPEWVTISFTDTGIGMDKETLEKVFEPLFTTKSKGIGLGLALTKLLVEGHGGTIEAQSKEGKGTTFTIRMPPD